MADPTLSIVIPAYNEAKRLPKSLAKLRSYAASKDFELIVVDDGSADATPELLEAERAAWPRMRVLRHQPTRGKGYSVRQGVLEARGQYVLFSDADFSTPIEEADRLLEILEARQADAVIGSRALRREMIGIRQHWVRESSGRLFNLVVRASTGLSFHDTQCGFKLFRCSTTRFAFERQRVDGFGFDPEILFLIQRAGGKIVEAPVHWDNDPATTVRFVRDSTRMLVELGAIRWRAWRGKYGPPHLI